MTEQNRIEHNKVFEEASAIAMPEIPLHDPRLGRPGWWLRRKLRRALRMFDRVLELKPENWSAMWIAGKVHQRLGEEEAAFSFFGRAYQANPSQPDVAREASLLAMDLGRADAAIVYAHRAMQVEPESAGLRANLALAYVLAGKTAEAKRCIEDSLRMDPADTISQTIRDIVEHFAAIQTDPPRRTKELMKYWQAQVKERGR
jgi:tetratricopeptide (TPR) repeat protein